MLPRGAFARALLVGLVVVVVALAGVHLYNIARLDAGELAAHADPILARARAISERSRPEYQDLALATLPPNPSNGAYYRFDDKLHEAKVVEEPAKLPPTADGALVKGFEFDDPGAPDLVAATGAAPRVDGGLLEVESEDDQGYLTNAGAISIPRDGVGDVMIRARASEETWMTLAWSKDPEPDDPWKNKLEVRLLGDGKFHTYAINGRNALHRGLGPDESLTRLYVKPTSNAGADVAFDYIRFLSERSRYLDASKGVLYERVAGELRKVLYMLPSQTLEWAVDLPQNAPVLEFGNGILLDGHPITFEVSLAAEDGSQSTSLHTRTLASASSWHDVRLDLSPWAGKRVRVRLKVTGDSQNVALWSNPILRSAPKRRFNVIIVLEDALRADHLSNLGYADDTSPNKAALMQERGIQFDWAISQATKTRPSVPALMTSLYPTATGVWHFSDMLSERYLTLAEIMRAQGFATASFIQNGNAGPYAGLHQGFSELYDETMVGQAAEDIFGQQVFSWLERHRDRNFFLYLHAIDPHGPYDPPPPFDAGYREVAGKGTPVQREDYLEPESVREPTDEGRRQRYLGEIRHNDSVLPRLLGTLDELGLTEDTLLVLLADHGEYMGEHGYWEHHPPSLLPVVHVPLMMTYPRRFKEAKRIEDPVQLIDVMPTVLELAEVDRTDLLMEGDSLLPLIEGRDPERWRNRVVIAEEPTSMDKDAPCPCASLFFQNWHVISSTSLWPARYRHHLSDLQAFAKTRVYDFRNDPSESGVRLSFLPDLYVRWVASGLISTLRDTDMATWRKLTEAENVDLRLDPATLERLKGLGYVN